MVSVSASVNLLFRHKVQKFSSGTGSPGWSRKKGRKTVVVVVVVSAFIRCTYFIAPCYSVFCLFEMNAAVLLTPTDYEVMLSSYVARFLILRRLRVHVFRLREISKIIVMILCCIRYEPTVLIDTSDRNVTAL